MGMTEAATAALPQLAAVLADAGTSLPQTGRAIPLLAAGVAIGVALLLRIGGWRLSAGDTDGQVDADTDTGAENGVDPSAGTAETRETDGV